MVATTVTTAKLMWGGSRAEYVVGFVILSYRYFTSVVLKTTKKLLMTEL